MQGCLHEKVSTDILLKREDPLNVSQMSRVYNMGKGARKLGEHLCSSLPVDYRQGNRHPTLLPPSVRCHDGLCLQARSQDKYFLPASLYFLTATRDLSDQPAHVLGNMQSRRSYVSWAVHSFYLFITLSFQLLSLCLACRVWWSSQCSFS